MPIVSVSLIHPDLWWADNKAELRSKEKDGWKTTLKFRGSGSTTGMISWKGA